MITGVINSITAGIQGLVAAFQEGGIQAVFSQITLSIQTFLTNLQANMPMFITAGMQMITGLIQGIIANLPVVITLALQFIQTFATVLQRPCRSSFQRQRRRSQRCFKRCNLTCRSFCSAAWKS